MSERHGGRLLAAAHRHGIAPAQWLDLSTGINPRGYPVPSLAEACWHRLPEPEDGLHAQAAAYYGSPHLRAVAGSQVAIAWLPRLRRRSRVAIVGPTYSGVRAAGQSHRADAVGGAAGALAGPAGGTGRLADRR